MNSLKIGILVLGVSVCIKQEHKTFRLLLPPKAIPPPTIRSALLRDLVSCWRIVPLLHIRREPEFRLSVSDILAVATSK